MDIKVDVTSNRKLIEEASDEAILRALTAIGQQAEGYAKDELARAKPHADGTVRPNRITGRLINSMTHDVNVSEKAVYIGTNVEYAPYVEMGTSRSRPYPYLKPAVTKHVDEYRDMVEHFLKNG
ncbi:MAG: hypothetical protein K6F28_09935 [Lachnospiraceae bacterium]|nr:hypothetical protein [Lachnospiraceae bacterium]